VEAPPKSGKKEIMIAMCKQGMTTPNKEVHVLITSLNTKDTKSQKNECEKNGLCVLVLKNKKDINDAINTIKNLCEEYETVFIHFDESDYGTDKSQLFNQVYTALNQDKIRWIYYSASNEELKYGARLKFEKDSYEEVIFTPSTKFKGADWFLNNNLVIQAEPFWDFENQKSNKQCEEILQLLASQEPYYNLNYENRKINVPYIAVARVAYKLSSGTSAYKSLKTNCDFHNYCMNNYNVKCKFIDEENSFNWDDLESYDNLNPNYKYLFIINMTARRSTELICHPHLIAWHDDPRDDSALNTIIQCLRIFHYDDEGYKIKLYCDVATVKYIAKEEKNHISLAEWIDTTNNRQVSCRIKSSQENVKKYDVTYLCNKVHNIKVEAEKIRGKSKIVTMPDGITRFHNDTVAGNTEYNLAKLCACDEPHKYTGTDTFCWQCGDENKDNRKGETFACKKCGNTTPSTRGTWLNSPCLEQDVYQYIIKQGLSNADIATKLQMNLAEIENYVNHINKKSKKNKRSKKGLARDWFGTESFVEACKYIIKHNPLFGEYWDTEKQRWKDEVFVFAKFDLRKPILPPKVNINVRNNSAFAF
jgi:hypothetical protein